MIAFGGTAKSHFQASFRGFFTSGRRCRGRRSDLLKLPITMHAAVSFCPWQAVWSVIFLVILLIKFAYYFISYLFTHRQCD